MMEVEHRYLQVAATLYRFCMFLLAWSCFQSFSAVWLGGWGCTNRSNFRLDFYWWPIGAVFNSSLRGVGFRVQRWGIPEVFNSLQIPCDHAISAYTWWVLCDILLLWDVEKHRNLCSLFCSVFIFLLSKYGWGWMGSKAIPPKTGNFDWIRVWQM